MVSRLTRGRVVNIGSVRSNSHMICPLLEKRSGNARLGIGTQPNLFRLRDGADDETTRRAVESNGEEDHLVGSSRDHRGDGADDAQMARAMGGARLFRIGRSA